MAISEVAKNRKTDYKSNRPKPQKPQLLLASLRRESVASLAREMTTVEDVAGEGAGGGVRNGRATERMQLDAQGFGQVGGAVGRVVFQEGLLVAHRITLLAGLANVTPNFLAFGGDGYTNLGSDLVRCVGLLGDGHFDDSWLAVTQASSLADLSDLSLIGQFAHTTLQGAAADDVGEDFVQIVDADAVPVPGNLGLNPCGQILRKLFWQSTGNRRLSAPLEYLF